MNKLGQSDIYCKYFCNLQQDWGRVTPRHSTQRSHLLFHLLNLPDEASPRLPVVVAQQVDIEVSRLAELLLLLLLSVLQLALSADALGVVHVVRFHHLPELQRETGVSTMLFIQQFSLFFSIWYFHLQTLLECVPKTHSFTNQLLVMLQIALHWYPSQVSSALYTFFCWKL